MDWIKIPTDSILYSEFKDSELLVIIKYQALFCQLEKEPSEAQLNRIFNKKEVKLIQSYKEVVQELCENQINSVAKKRNKDKENYKQKQFIAKNSASETNAERIRNVGVDKIREDAESENKENSPHTPHKENIKISPNGDTKSFSDEFLYLWKIYNKQRAGNKQKAYAAYCRVLKERRATSQELLASVKEYAESREVARGFAKGCAAWLNDDRFAVEYEPEETDSYVSPEIPVCCNSPSRSPLPASTDGMYDWWLDGTQENRA